MIIAARLGFVVLVVAVGCGGSNPASPLTTATSDLAVAFAGAGADMTSLSSSGADLASGAVGSDLAMTPLPAGACTGGGAEITTLPSCATAAAATVDVKSGCAPTVDGVLHAAEWADATCFNTVFSDHSTDEVVYMKYAGDSLYFATSGIPQSGGPMYYFFDPTAAATFNSSQFDWVVLDDPFKSDGDGGGSMLVSGQPATTTAAPAGIVAMCPPNQPSPLRYEWKIPLSALGITPGSAHTFSLGYVNMGAFKGNSQWPQTLKVSTTNSLYPGDPSTWGRISSSTNWH